MARVKRYRENHVSFGQFIMSEQAMKPTMQVAQAMSRTMRATAPRSSDKRGQPYADSFAVRANWKGIVAGKYRNRRVAATIVNTADHAPALEFGRDYRNRLGKDRRVEGRRVMLRAGLVYGDSNMQALANSGIKAEQKRAITRRRRIESDRPLRKSRRSL